MEKDSLLKRIDGLMAIPLDSDVGANHLAGERISGATIVAEAIYGKDNAITKQLQDHAEALSKDGGLQAYQIGMTVQGILKAIRADVQAGILSRMRMVVAGELMGDLLGLGKAVFESGGDERVAAVLAAAAFEETVRRMGEDFAEISDGKVDLSEILLSLAKRSVIQGASVRFADSCREFRNRALHADWDKIDRASIGSALECVHQLLLKHYSG